MVTYSTHSEDETIALGRKLAAAWPAQALVLLIGDLGAGKTTLTKGIVEGRGLADSVTSPTFTLIHEYGVPARVFHIDLYRLDESREVEALGLDELLDRPALTLIEWGERFPELWPRERIEVRLRRRPDESREIEVILCPHDETT
ncbi:MAG: tRNA (adenosine(37)-N6)-threonylcarbamoyltransferase complex ATPase subunit type 1 TsaE [Bryobacteraceae bacterium]|nr:tRNA (adenosine(37)-N6)-threonylcarbamoyltransferase complex ATPase subunit type 1 TsaE [Bryobacteraceae bacterium]